MSIQSADPILQQTQPQQSFLQTVFKSNCLRSHFNANSTEEQSIPSIPFHRLLESPDSTEAVSQANIDPIEAKPEVRVDEKIGSVEEFVRCLWPYAKAAAGKIGLDPRVLLAQVALETGWGKSITSDANGSSSNNLFNIKAKKKNKDSVLVTTTEYQGNLPIKTTAAFKKYGSLQASFDDYLSLLTTNNRYEQTLANTSNPERYINELHKAGYATDPKYASKILAIYNGEELTNAVNQINGC